MIISLSSLTKDNAIFWKLWDQYSKMLSSYCPPPLRQYLSQDGELLLGESTELPLLAMPLTPQPIVEEMVLGSAVGFPAGEPVSAPSHRMPDLYREGPFDVHQDASESGASPRVLDSLPGCQYRMTSYDENVDRSDLSPTYIVFIFMIRDCYNTLVRQSRLDSSAVVRSISYTTWVRTERWRLLYSCSMTVD